MTFQPPITAGGSSVEYTQKFKKHFGDRPTAFALSESRPSSSSSSSSASASSHLFGSREEHAMSHPAASSSSSSSFVGQGEVDGETHAQLANLGWRIRSRINQGYLRTSTSHPACAPQEGFLSERDILRNVTNTRRGWSRVSTAPTIASTFDELRTGTPRVPTPCDAAPAAASRELTGKRRLSESDSEDTVDMTDYGAQRRIAGLPQLSFSSSVSSTSSHEPGFPTSPHRLHHPPLHPRTFSRSHSSAHSSSHPSSMDMDTEMPDEVPTTAALGKAPGREAYDFSSHFNRTDF
ncbi:hypothetical protein EX895_002858 [Sporisorium graminicola]|uniref:Uncharacterized protein n=1 Tax=Sporisorium graminicola TaxID=280036 RepID=A0A4U7KXM4_9BASI|nr:hypothetical protein EX895_002858 [Sporisorium graminicola]TKY88148.1 hypothetical protein EX895_002858 [Sporisorium graminicola]